MTFDGPGVCIEVVEPNVPFRKFDPLGPTALPLPKAYTHDCGKCVYLGTADVLELMSDVPKRHDFYRCDAQITGTTYIARYGSLGSEYTSFPVAMLCSQGFGKWLSPELLNILVTEATIDRSNYRSDLHFAIESFHPSEVTIVVSLLLDERTRRYIEDAVARVQHFQYSAMTPSTSYLMLKEIDALVHYQIQIDR